MKRRLALVVAGLCALVATVAALAARTGDDGPATASPAPAWRDLGPAPLDPNAFAHVAFAAGRLVVVTPERPRESFEYDVWARTWRRRDPPSGGIRGLVASGDRLAVVPGQSDRVVELDDGGTSTWTKSALAPAPFDQDSLVTWVGDELAVVGQRTAATYDVSERRWRRLPALGGIAQPMALVARGDDLVAAAWTGNTGDPGIELRVLRRGGRSWRPLPLPHDGALDIQLASAPGGFVAAWPGPDGTELAFSGPRPERSPGGGPADPRVVAPGLTRVVVSDGVASAVYDRRTRRWRNLPALPFEPGQVTTVWADGGLLSLVQTSADRPPRLYSLSLSLGP